jgi:hypothetical protein
VNQSESHLTAVINGVSAGLPDRLMPNVRHEHHAAPTTWRTMNTVRAAATMKTAVAAIERGEKRAIPQTPCPLVQPLPSWVP